MEIEKVKTIKKALEYCYNGCDCECYRNNNGKDYDDCKNELIIVALTLINELESENERLQEQNGALSCDLEYLHEKLTNAEIEVDDYKDRIAELEKENAELLNSVEMVQNNRCTIICELTKKQLKQFAERLKEKFNDTEYRAKTKRKTISVEELKAQMDWILHEVVIKNIDETLKEFIND